MTGMNGQDKGGRVAEKLAAAQVGPEADDTPLVNAVARVADATAVEAVDEAALQSADPGGFHRDAATGMDVA